MNIFPYILGRGAAAQAMQKALYVAILHHPEWTLQPATQCDRGQIPPVKKTVDAATILFIANPHALHSQAITQGAQAGFSAIVTEKPACIDLSQSQILRGLKNLPPTAVCHGYRMMWGIQTLRAMIDADDFGKIIAIEGRYWQSSAAQRFGLPASDSWKNRQALSGPSDVLLDLGSHWADLMTYLAGSACESASVWTSHVNAEAPHRDTHVHLSMAFPTVTRTFGSVSKTVHGAGNDLELHVIGEKARGSWTFARPDVLVKGIGANEHTIVRQRTETSGSQQAPFHGLGWLEGYTTIIEHLLLQLAGRGPANYPQLSEVLNVMEILFKAQA